MDRGLTAPAEPGRDPVDALPSLEFFVDRRFGLGHARLNVRRVVERDGGGIAGCCDDCWDG